MAARRAGWKRQRADPQDKQLMRAVRREKYARSAGSVLMPKIDSLKDTPGV